MLLNNRKRFKKYLLSILVGIPVWYVISQLAVQSAAYAKELNIQENITGGRAVMYHYIGASLGSLLFGWFSERWRSRRKALFAATGSLALFVGVYFFMHGVSASAFYLIIGLMGISMGGLWSVFMANASEQFGTNLRATVTTSAPNFVRGTTELIRIGIASLRVNTGLLNAGLIIGVVVILLSLVAIFFTQESHGKELDYTELS